MDHRRYRRARRPAKKLNVKLLVALLLIPVFLLIATVAIGFFMNGEEGLERLTRRDDPAYYIEKGNSLMAQGKYSLAVKQFEVAAVKESSSTEALMCLVKALKKTEPENQGEATRNTTRIIGLLYRVAEMDPDNEEVQKQLLELLYEAVQSLGQGELVERLYEMSDKFYENHSERTYALRFKALAQMEMLKKEALSDLERVNARDDLERALKLFPDDENLVSALSLWNAMEASRLKAEGEDDASANRHEKLSQDILVKKLQKNPGNHEIKLQLTRTLYAHRKEEVAAKLLAELEADMLKSPKEKIVTQVANFLMVSDKEVTVTQDGNMAIGGVVRANALLTRALDQFPENLEILLNLAILRKKMGLNEDGVELLKRAIAAAPKEQVGVGAMAERQMKFAAMTELANTYLVMTEKQLAKEEHDALISNAQELIDQLGREIRSSALVDLLEGKIALLNRQIPRAIEKFELADRKFNGRNPEAVFLSAIALNQAGETGAAIQRMERLAEDKLSPNVQLRADRELAELYVKTGNLPLALQKIDRCLALATEDQESLMIKSDILARMDRARQRETGSDAPGTLSSSVALLQPLVDAGDMKARVQLAQLYRGNGMLEEAVSVLEGGLIADPNNLVLLQQLVQIDLQMEKKERALARLDKAIEALPDNRLLPLLRQQVAGGQHTAEMLEKMLQEMDDPFQSAFGLYTFYKNTNRAEEAAASLAKAAELKPQDPKVLNAQFSEAIGAEDWDAAQKICDTVAELDLDQARGAFWQGRLELARKQYIRAAYTFQTGVKKRPLFSNGWLMLGDSHRLSGSLVEAETAYQEAIRLKPDKLNAVYNLFLVHNARGMQSAAMDDLERARRLAPEDRGVMNAYLAYLGQMNPEKALERRLEEMKNRPGDWRNRLEAGRLLRETGQEKRARELLVALFAEQPENLQVVLALAEDYREVGDVDKGRETLEDYIAKRGDEATVADWLSLARFLMSCELSDAAIAAYEEGIDIESSQEREASRELGDWYFNNQFFAKALPLYERAFEGSKDSPRLTLRYIETLIYNNKAERAGELLKDYVEAQEESAQTALLQCIIAIETKEFDAAASYAETAVKLGPTNPQAYLYRARLNYLRAGAEGTKRHVVRDLEKALSFDGTILAAREMLVDCYLQEEPPNVRRAIDQLREIVTAKPDAAQARIRLISLLLERNDLERATEQIAAGIEAMPDLPAWYTMRAAVLQQQGKQQEALADLQRLFELAQNPQNLARLADGYVQAGKSGEALKLLNAYPREVAQGPMLMAIKGKAQLETGKKDMAGDSFEIAFKQAVGDPMALQQVFEFSSSLMPTTELVKILDEISASDASGMARVYAGQLLIKAGRDTDGIARFEAVRKQLPKTHPAMSRVLHTLATAYQKTEDFPAAAGIYRELIQLKPQDVVAYNNLAYILCENLDQAAEAVTAAAKALSLAPDDDVQKSNIMDTLGWAYYRSGELDKARINLTESVRYNQGLHNQWHLAQVLIERGFNREARGHLRSLRRTAQKLENTEFEEKADKLLDELR